MPKKEDDLLWILDNIIDDIKKNGDKARAGMLILFKMKYSEALNLSVEMREIICDLLGDSTNSYCEWCRKHAPKDEDGRLTGPISHTEGCARLEAERLLARTEIVP